MKNKILLFTSFVLLVCIIGCNNGEAKKNVDEEEVTSVYSTPDLKDITKKWVSNYSGKFPEARIKYVDTPESSIPTLLNEERSIAFISEAYIADMDADFRWMEAVGREVIVPVISESNPYASELDQRGISISELSAIIGNKAANNWSQLDESWADSPLSVYVVENSALSDGLAELFNVESINYKSAEIINEKRMLTLVKSDPTAIGFCFLNDILDKSRQNIADGVKIVPIDRNSNGKIDHMESIYGSLGDFDRGVWIGKYPGVLSNNIYSASTQIPSGTTERSFLRWVLTNGQPLLANYGYKDLISAERLATINMLKDQDTLVTASESYSRARGPFYVYFPIGLTAAIILFLVIYHGAKYLAEKKNVIPGLISDQDKVLNNNLIKSPQGLYYDKTHTWAYMEKDGMVKLGIDDFLQHITGPISSIKMKKPGDRVRKGSHIVSIAQNGKQLDIYSAITGTIVEQNEPLLKNTSTINSSPYTDGWIYRIEPANWLKEIQFMFMGSGYRDWLKNEFVRFKEFLTNTMISTNNVEYARVLQDGGEIKDGILKDFGPKVWEDFQSNFIDTSV